MSKKHKKVISEPMTVQAAPKKKFGVMKVTVIILSVLVLTLMIGMGALAYTYLPWKTFLGQKLTPQEELQSVITRVSNIAVLPDGESPTLATVQDINKLKDQKFFANAQNGDQVLIYSKAKKAFLYRPSTDQLVEVGPVNVPANAEVAGAQTQIDKKAPVKIVLLNGTLTTGLTRTAEQELINAKLLFEVINRDNAARNDYEQTLVVDLSGTHPEDVEALVSQFNAQKTQLPEGEARPENADVLIILGSSYSAQ